jgi:rhamnosyltransferase
LRSSTGEYFIGLDHVRAVAAFFVFSWHFIHVYQGHMASPPVFPLSLLSEGHTGVAIFMTLSGYVFAKLLEGKNIKYTSFIWNRFLRLAPLLIIIIIIVGYQNYLVGNDLLNYAKKIVAGVIKPSFPNGGWAITVELHFYLVLPVLLFLVKRWKYSLVFILVLAVFTRTLLYLNLGQIQTLSFLTIVGRIDQFLLGIMAYQFRSHISGKHFLIAGVITLFTIFFWYFDSLGGFYMSPSYPSPSAIWIYLPTVEGVAYASMIAWYDNSFKHSTGAVSRFIARIGTYSYSIYLWHFFFVFEISCAISNYLVDLSNINIAILFSIVCFPLMVPIGYLSYKYIESPFLEFRTRYIVTSEPTASRSSKIRENP